MICQLGFCFHFLLAIQIFRGEYLSPLPVSRGRVRSPSFSGGSAPQGLLVRHEGWGKGSLWDSARSGGAIKPTWPMVLKPYLLTCPTKTGIVSFIKYFFLFLRLFRISMRKAGTLYCGLSETPKQSSESTLNVTNC